MLYISHVLKKSNCSHPKGDDTYKHYDRFKSGDSRKHNATEEEHYELRKCKEEYPAEKWYLAGFNAYREQFKAFLQEFPDTWIYFETLGEKIGARYAQLMPTVRVFDVSKNGKFLSFEKAKELALRFNLPVVKSHIETFGSLENLISMPTQSGSHDEGFPEHKLEGWVLRQEIGGQEVVAKIRVGDLKRLAPFAE